MPCRSDIKGIKDMLFFLSSHARKLTLRFNAVKKAISPLPLNIKNQWHYPEWDSYLNNPRIKNHPFIDSYLELRDISKQALDYDRIIRQYPSTSIPNPLRDTPYCFLIHTQKLSTRIKSLIPGTIGFQARINFAKKLGEVEKFIGAVEKDIAAPRKLEIYVQEKLQSLLGTKLVNLMTQSAKIMEQLERYKNSRTRPVYFLEHDYVKRNSNYAAFMFVSDHINRSKNNMVHAAKPEFYSPLKPINRNQVINIFPKDSVYKNFINQTSSWWGNLKSYVPFTDAYKAKNDVKKELNKVKRFIKVTVKEFSEHTRDDLVVKYPKITPLMEQIDQAAGRLPNVSVTDETGADLKLNIRDSAERPDIKQQENRIVSSASSSAARVLLRSSDDPSKSPNYPESPRTLEGELLEDLRFVDELNKAAQARLLSGLDASATIQSVTKGHAQLVNILTDKDNNNDNLTLPGTNILDKADPHQLTRKVRFTTGSI